MTSYAIDAERSEVHIAASSSLHGIDGHATGVTGTIEVGDDGTPLGAHIEVEADRIGWGNPLLDRETRRRIDVRAHPTITGDVEEAMAAGDGALHLRGVIAFRGVAREATGDVTVSASAPDRITIEGEQSFDVRDWGLEPPKLLLLRVDPVIRVRIRVEARVLGAR